MSDTHTEVPGTGIRFCTCNQAFSGHRADERLAEHVANPSPDEFGALLSTLLSQEPE